MDVWRVVSAITCEFLHLGVGLGMELKSFDYLLCGKDIFCILILVRELHTC